jgi:hypothetical protein
MRNVLLGVWLALAAGQCEAADSTQAAQRGTLGIRSDPDSAFVTIDGAYAGRTPLSVDTLMPGTHVIRVLHPDAANWLSASVDDTVFLQRGDIRILRYSLREGLSIVSVPSGAEVFVGDSLAGRTPLVFLHGGMSASVLITLRKPGYLPIPAEFGKASGGVLRVALQQAGSGPVPDELILRNDAAASGRTERILISGVATVVAGAAAAYFKIKADKLNEDFLATGDPSLNSRTRRLDTASAIALAATQVGLALFSTFLLSE